MSPHFHLASRSPRRKALLLQLGLQFSVQPSDAVEQPRAGEAAADYARHIAMRKAQLVADRMHDGLPVLAADTDVVLDGEILGKPRDRDHGIAMLRSLSDRQHQVVSAVVVLHDGQAHSALTVTEVTFGTVTSETAAAYWDSGEAADKAGGYALQGMGGALVRNIKGSHSGVIGLPLYETVGLLQACGISVPGWTAAV